MPTYDYICDACGHSVEAFQSITAKPLRKCPECSRMKLVRQIGTGAGFIFKGSGFYETDYRSEGYKSAAKKEADAGKAKSDAKSDKKSGEKASGTSAGKSDTASKPGSKGSGGKAAGGTSKASD